MKRLDFAAADAALRAGGVVAIPTDTVYGVAASLERPEGIEKIFSLKKRPGAVALPVLLSEIEEATRLGVAFDERARVLAGRWWPGPLTIVVRASEEVAGLVHAVDGTVGLRVPDEPLTRRLIARVGPLCVTSANLHGEAPCVSAEQVEAVFEGRDEIAGVLDGGVHSSTVSTVVDVSGPEVQYRRSGAITAEEIDAFLSR